MKINYFRITFNFLLALLLAGCGTDDPIAEGNTKAPKPDTTAQQPGTAMDSASVQNLLQQYDPPGRDVWQKPEVVIGKMGDLSNKTVADIGAGSGFFSRRLAQQAKRVIAVELDPRFVQFMDSIKLVELKPEYQDRFETRLGLPNDPKLKPGEVDIVLVVNTYIYIQNRVEYLKNLLSVLPKGGKVIVVDFKKKRMPIKYPTADVRMELYEVENELDAAGFTNIQSDDRSLDYQYIVMGEK
ncbi:MAG: class I SAM-dependent methyltransferase [Saprospiraceae bacterium]|jgi:SAM-dependent methyltransferase|nr:class I SAM-dependent methyltransferase [Saprospiraceae bacterium]